MKGAAIGLLLVVPMWLCSACQIPPETTGIYTGPTATLDEVIARVNANNSAIPTLWARQNFEGTIVDDKHDSHEISADGVILYRAPHELLITAHNEFGSVFEIGVTAEVYWLKVVPSLDTLWWGKMANVGKPTTVNIPLRPDLILDVLAVNEIDPNLLNEPHAVMRFNNEADMYMVDTIVRAADRLLVQKEVWYDRQTLEPRKVLLYDAKGRVVLRANLSDFQAVASGGDSGGAGDTGGAAPYIAGTYKLFFPDTGSKMTFTLSQAALSKNGIPHAGSIHLPDLGNPGVGHVVQVDQ